MNRPKGTKDNYGDVQVLRDYLKNILLAVSQVFNFKEIETPIFERKEVFTKSVGETSDVVSKEMYEFKDKKDRDMVLRPEGTASVIRALVENKLYTNLPFKVFYYGPMFRYENPQKGRQRQFTQYGVEYIGDKNPYIDCEVIMMAQFILDSLQIPYVLKINSLGDKISRDKYSAALKEYFSKYKDKLSENSLQRLDSMPMRILDDKIDSEKDFVKNAPKISAFYSEESKNYFDKVTAFLKAMGIAFEIDHSLVRGFDYYTDTAFEFISKSENTGAQSTLIGGGRYENLVKNFGGPNISGIGFGIGIERMVNDIAEIINIDNLITIPHVYVLNISPESQDVVLGIVVLLRKAGLITEWNSTPLKIQKAFEKAEKSKAHFQIIAGAKELSEQKVIIKSNNEQHKVDITQIVAFIDKNLKRQDVDNNEKH